MCRCSTTTHSGFKWLKPAKIKFYLMWFHEFFPNKLQQINLTSFSGHDMHFIIKIRQTVAASQFHEFLCISIFGGFFGYLAQNTRLHCHGQGLHHAAVVAWVDARAQVFPRQNRRLFLLASVRHHYHGPNGKNPPKIRSKNSWNWLIILMPETVGQILNL